MLSAVKLWKSSSISGPSATSKPSERNSDSMRSSVRVTGCSVPTSMPRPGSETSSASAASCAASFESASAARRAARAASSLALASLIFAPAAGRSRGVELAERLQEIGERAGLAEVLRLAVLQRGGIGTRGEIGQRGGDDAVEFFHRSVRWRCVSKGVSRSGKKKGGGSPPSFCRDSIRPERLWPAPRSWQKRPCRARRGRRAPSGRRRSTPSSSRS